MSATDRAVLERLRSSCDRYRRLAEIHESFGEHQKSEDCLALAELQEERARRVEQRLGSS